MSAATEDLLRAYREKRDFSRTREPQGGASAGAGLVFVVQKHDATRLHYDFRLEWGGVLKSWAVTKGPSLDPSDKRLAVRTEDHPMDYGDFEGTIPEGQYGGGTVMLWDFGLWEPREDVEEGFEKGSLKLSLHGEKMTGHWALVRMKPRGRETRENWLLIKEKDEVASSRRNILNKDRSVKTGRTMAQIAKGDDIWKQKTKRPSTTAARPKPGAPRKKVALPAFRPLQLATLVTDVPTGREWLHELKYDGYRVLIALAGGEARLYTRNELDWTQRFAALVPALRDLPCRSALIDGEIVAFDSDGAPDFSALQKALKEGGPLACFAFDLLELNGTDLSAKPLVERKARLETLVEKAGSETLLYSQHVRGSGGRVLGSICKSGHEGIVSKLADAPYRPGRSRSWVKTKCTKRQEFVIGGFSPSDKKGRPFASILLGAFEGGKLRYRGRVGSGFTEETMGDLSARFSTLARKQKPFETLPREIARGARFVKPELIAEVDFTEFTADGHIRHGVFKGLREDKEAQAVTGETPQPTPGSSNGEAEVSGVRLTSPGRIVFHTQGTTKLELARYYEAAADRMLAHAANRPVSLVRCPQSGAKRCFFQKHDTGGFPEAMGHVEVTEKDGGQAAYLSLSGVESIIAAVQMNTLEFHIWGSRNDQLERPDRLVFDLDPDESLTFEDVKSAALDLRDRLGQAGLATVPLVTGGKGVHVIAPLSRRQDWEEVKDFAKAVASLLAQEAPERFVATMSKAKRKGRIFIDWLRNERGQTAIAPYSTRSREGAPVAAPVSWSELATLKDAHPYRIPQMHERLADDDPWSDIAGLRQSITAKARRLFSSA